MKLIAKRIQLLGGLSIAMAPDVPEITRIRIRRIDVRGSVRLEIVGGSRGHCHRSSLAHSSDGDVSARELVARPAEHGFLMGLRS